MGGFTCDFLQRIQGEEEPQRITISKQTRKYSSDKLKDFIDELYKLFGLGYASADMKSLKFQFTFAKIPKGGSASESREYHSILNKRSEVKIVNDDNNCFWYSLAVCMNPDNRMVKHPDRPNTRIKFGKNM